METGIVLYILSAASFVMYNSLRFWHFDIRAIYLFDIRHTFRKKLLWRARAKWTKMHEQHEQHDSK